MWRLVPTDQRQVEEMRHHWQGRHKGAGARQRLRRHPPPVKRRIDAHRLGDLERGLFHPVHPPKTSLPLQRDQVARADPLPRRRHRQAQPVPRQPRLAKPAFGHGAPLATGQRQRHIAARHGMGGLVRHHRLLGHRRVIGIRLHESQPHPTRLLGLRRAGELRLPVGFALGDNFVRRDPMDHRIPAHDKAQDAVPLHRVEPMGQHQRLQHCPRIRDLVHDIAAHTPDQARHVDPLQTGPRANLGHHIGQRLHRQPAIDPVSAMEVHPVRPKRSVVGKERKRPRIPCPDKGVAHIHHRPAVMRRHGIVLRHAPVPCHRLQIPDLDQIIARAIRIGRQPAFRTAQIHKPVWRIGSLVHGGTAQLGEPDRLRHRHPIRRLTGPNATYALVMLMFPPAANILVAPDPVFAMRPVHDLRPPLRRLRLGSGVVPVIPLPPRDIRGQVIGVVDTAPRRIRMILAVPPVRQRHVIVDPDEIDIVICPERIEVKEHIPRPVLRMVAEIFRPIGGIADLDLGPENRTNLRRQRAQLRHRRKAVASPPQRGQPAHLRPDAKGVNTPRRRAKRRVMQDEPPEPPFIRTSVSHSSCRDVKIRRLRLPEERRDLLRHRRRAIRGPRAPRRDRGTDPPAPRHLRLLRPAIGVGQAVALKLVHQHKGIEHHPFARRLHRHDRLDHRCIGRRAAIDHPFRNARHLLRLRTTQPRHHPRHPLPVGVAALHLRADLARPAAQITPEPRHHQRRRLQRGRFRLQGRQRRAEIRHAQRRVHIRRPRASRAARIMHRRRGQRIFPRSGDHRHCPHRPRQNIARLGRRRTDPHHLKGKLRHAVAEPLQRQFLDHHIGRATIGGHHPCAFHRLHHRIGKLRHIPAIDRHPELGGRDLLTIGPDPRNMGYLSLAQRNRKAHRIAVGGRLRGTRRALAGAPRHRRRLDEIRGPDYLPAHAHAAKHLRHDRALRRACQAQPVHLARDHRFGPRPHDPLVDQPAQRRAHRAPDHGGGHPRHRATNARPDRGPGRRQKDCRHHSLPSGKTNRATTRRLHGVLNALSITPRPE